MVQSPRDLLSEAGYTLAKPLAEKARERLWSKIDARVPSELKLLYESCNGASSRKAECRILPLAEAIDLIAAYDHLDSFKFLPFFESKNALSDPCMVILDSPLRGYVFHYLHDGQSRVLSSTVLRFLQILGKLTPARVDLEKVAFDYPRTLSQTEKTAIQTIRAEVTSSNSWLGNLADSMTTEKKPGWSAQIMAEAPHYAQFLDRCEAALKKAGIEVLRDDHSGLLVGPKKKAFFWQGLQKQQKGKNLETFIVEFVKPKLG